MSVSPQMRPLSRAKPAMFAPPMPDHTDLSLTDEPGITYDGQLRLFRLRCKNSLYAFRVDDARNLEHLYWGPPLPPTDDITYLIRSHVPTPFDPKGTISIAKALGLEELGDLENVDDISASWKVYTKRSLKPADEGHEHSKRNRRLENASWRLWHMERNRGGDLNRDLSESTVARALGEEIPKADDDKQPERHSVTFPDTPQPPSSSSVRISLPSESASAQAPLSKPLDRKKSLRASRSMADVARLGNDTSSNLSKTPSNRTPVPFGVAPTRAPKEGPTLRRAASRMIRSESRITRSGSRTRSAATSPRLMSKVSSQNYSPIAGSFADLTLQDQSTNWHNLDPEILGKNTKLMEFSDAATGDYRDPSFKVTFSKDGSSVCPVEYMAHKIVAGKPPMPSRMPGMYTDTSEEATTLIVDMEDSLTGLRFLLYYTVYHDFDVITRRTVVVNRGHSPVTVKHLVSGTFDFDAESKYYMTQLAGGWARERDIVTQKLEYGMNVVKSVRGASSHQFNPFIVITPDHEPAEDHGECFGFALVYSGNFAAATEVTEYGRLRVNMGINPEGFTWHLDSTRGSNSFSTPEVVMSYSSTGIGDMSRTLHRAFRERLVPCNWRYKVPPVLINTWEAAYFDVTHEIVVEIAHAAAKANVELLVLDDGWFGIRNDTCSGLGDWTPNYTKFPFGIDGVARAVNQVGMKFGIWVEPEMVSVASDLYRAHSDWCLCVPTRSRTTGRNQLVLDFSRSVVRDHIYGQLHTLLKSANIEYVKWDMNRHLTEVFSQEWHAERQGEISHRFILGVYEVLGRLTEEFPHVLFETCSGGGGRFDAGMLYFSPQIWASDNTDALSRVSIQYGTSLAYPASAMGAHVSTVPNHQTLRYTPMKTRSVVAMSGTFGYELDPRGFSEEDYEEVRGYIDLQKKMAPIVCEGDMYRLWSPFTSDSAAWMFVSRDKRKAYVVAVNIRRVVGRLLPRLKLRGLSIGTTYRVTELCPGTVVRNPDTGAIDNAPLGVYQYATPLNMTGCTLQNAGLPVKFLFDADSVFFELEAIDLARANGL